MTIRSNTRVLALAGTAAALVAAALALWLSAAGPSDAASADQVQGTAVTVVDRTISWGSAGDCVQSMDTADFGAVLPGAFPVVHGFNGCVTSNTSDWSVNASGTALTETAGASSIPSGNLLLKVVALGGSAAGTTSHCGTYADCDLGASRTVVSGGAAGVGEFAYDYALSVPGNSPGGTYTGAVTFTAAN